MLICFHSTHHLSATTQTQVDSPGVDPPRYANRSHPYESTMLRSHTGIVVGVAVGFAFYSLGRKLVVDKQMRLTRQNRKE